MRATSVSTLACLLVASSACRPDSPSDDTATTGETGETGETGDTNEPVEAGLLGCPRGHGCTIVAVSQTIDDRLELFTGRGAGPTYRGAIELDMKPNPNGDVTGELLDEPYGLAWDGAALHVLVGHFPSREVGSLLSFPASGLADHDGGSFVALGEWFDGAQAVGLGARLRPLHRTEPMSMIVDPATGQLLIAVFANDLMIPDTMWTNPSELLVLGDEDTPRAVASGCAGAWSIAALDPEGEAVALACDGDERVAILDAGSLAEGRDPSPRCVGEVPFAGKSVRYLAPDGLGGVVLTEHPIVVSGTERARLWWFDAACGLRGFVELESDSSSWILRELELLPSVGDPRWLLARADGDARGVVILAGDPGAGTITTCGRLTGLDEAGAWTASGGAEGLRPHALALTEDGRGLAVGAGPANYSDTEAGYGSVWWTELDYGDEPCEAVAVEPTQLSASAPAVDPRLPQTWRRAPDVVHLIEVGG